MFLFLCKVDTALTPQFLIYGACEEGIGAQHQIILDKRLTPLYDEVHTKMLILLSFSGT